MPREIITLQAGQCGNQSMYAIVRTIPVSDASQLGLNSGHNCAQNTVSAKMERSRTLRPKAEIARMSSSTKWVPNHIIDVFWLKGWWWTLYSSSNLVGSRTESKSSSYTRPLTDHIRSLAIFSALHFKIYTIQKISILTRTEVVLATIGHKAILLASVCLTRSWKW